ncbi:DNA topoisomerase 4 subunit A [symbiont of Argiope bruennichi]|uniref:DNA topoisomerase (ATP-hydrolyzing) n=1 Tax=symbiont of Argiope bruennichi TaxID=2810479 RepID=UPI003DA4900C
MKIETKLINEEVKKSFLNYSMSVIIGRTIPDVRDGFKPVVRRIIYSMYNLKNFYNSSYKKSARIVGEVIGKYHPHGDSSIYEAIVKLAQPFNINHTLIDGHGNFGSIDGDSYAAMRYTEIRLDKIATEIVSYLEKDTVDFVKNYDNTEDEPKLLPTLFPYLIINGSLGIAVGMATSILPHNLNEVIDAFIYYIKNKTTCSIENLLNFIKGPDFPTKGEILFKTNVTDIYKNGVGTIVLKGNIKLEKSSSHYSLIIDEIPYQVNKLKIIEKINLLITSKEVTEINNVRDESNFEGIRIVLELKSNFNPEYDLEILKNKLFSHTPLQEMHYFNFLAIKDNVPIKYNLLTYFQDYFIFRKEIELKKLNFELSKLNKTKEILSGFLICLNNIDEVIKIIKSSNDVKNAKINLIERFSFSEVQVIAILELKLQRLTKLEINNIQSELDKTIKEIEKIDKILETETSLDNHICKSLENIKNLYGRERQTKISGEYKPINIESLIKNEKVIISISNSNYIKKTSIDEFKLQHRGGVGTFILNSLSEDNIKKFIVANNLDNIYFLSNMGYIFQKKAYEINKSLRTSRGQSFANYFNFIKKDEKVVDITNFDKDSEDKYLFLITKQGLLKKILLKNLIKIYKSGKRVIKIRDNDNLLTSLLINDGDEVIIGSLFGKVIKLFTKDIPTRSTNATYGNLSLKLSEGDEIVSVTRSSEPECQLLSVTDKGYGKIFSASIIKHTNRRATGRYVIKDRKNNGNLISLFLINNEEELLIVTTNNKTIRINLSEIRKVKGKLSKGVILVNLKNKEKVSYCYLN